MVDMGLVRLAEHVQHAVPTSRRSLRDMFEVSWYPDGWVHVVSLYWEQCYAMALRC